MRRYFLGLFVFLFGIVVVGISIWRSRLPLVTLAIENGQATEEVVDEASSEEAQVEEDDYSLPYPGILPDHPLYFLKMIRDRIKLWLVSNPLARAELMLHYGDKRIAASLSLAEKGKAGLAVTTATKAEKYLERVMNEAEGAAVDQDVTGFGKQAARAIQKHEKVLVGVMSLVPDEAKSAVEQALETNERVYERALKMAGPQGVPALEEAVDEESVETEEDVKGIEIEANEVDDELEGEE